MKTWYFTWLFCQLLSIWFSSTVIKIGSISIKPKTKIYFSFFEWFITHMFIVYPNLCPISCFAQITSPVNISIIIEPNKTTFLLVEIWSFKSIEAFLKTRLIWNLINLLLYSFWDNESLCYAQEIIRDFGHFSTVFESKSFIQLAVFDAFLSHCSKFHLFVAFFSARSWNHWPIRGLILWRSNIDIIVFCLRSNRSQKKRYF